MRRFVSAVLALSFCLCLFMTVSASASADTIEYTNTITIYDITGTQELYTYSMSGEGLSPEFSLVVSATGCTISSSAGNAVYLFSGSDFAGFAVTPNGSVVYGIGGLMTGGGDEYHHIYSLYVVQAVEEKEYENTVLGWFENLFDSIINLPSKIWDFLRSGFDSIVSAISGLPAAIADALSFFDAGSLFEGFDFSPITDFFTEAWENVKSGFGLKEFIEDPEGPFGWLSSAADTTDDDGNWMNGVLTALSVFGLAIDALPVEIVTIFVLIFCGVVVVALLKVF